MLADDFCSYPKIGTWAPIVRDDQWHHTCIRPDFVAACNGNAVKVSSVIWYNQGCNLGGYTQGDVRGALARL